MKDDTKSGSSTAEIDEKRTDILRGDLKERIRLYDLGVRGNVI
jgi:hypothetical protein